MAKNRTPLPALGTVLPMCQVQTINLRTHKWVTVLRCMEDGALIRKLLAEGGHTGLHWVRDEFGDRYPLV